jgi:lipoyl(octanoyl) transferase
MQRITDTRDEHTPDEIWLLEHPPVFTLGLNADAGHVLAAGDIPVIHVDRGGQVTYHGPGQIVAYPLLDLKRLKIGVREYVHRIEQAVIDTLADWNISAQRRDGAPGVYVDEAKVAALGIRVRRGCSFHGLAFNIAMDLEPFQRINPCGYAGLEVTSMLELCGESADFGIEAVKPRLLRHLADQFGLGLQSKAELPGLSIAA